VLSLSPLSGGSQEIAFPQTPSMRCKNRVHQSLNGGDIAYSEQGSEGRLKAVCECWVHRGQSAGKRLARSAPSVSRTKGEIGERRVEGCSSCKEHMPVAVGAKCHCQFADRETACSEIGRVQRRWPKP
jgi:hypothetical protein